MGSSHRIAVVGAGLSGLTAARALQETGHAVEVFDKGRGLGGRLATRRIDGGQFDHGALLMQPKRAAFAQFLESAEAAGAAASWPAAEGWVGLPGMSGLLRPLAQGLTISNSVEIKRLERGAEGWRLWGSDGAALGPYGRLVLAIPQPQAHALLEAWPEMAAAVGRASMRPCWAALCAFEEPLATPGPLLTLNEGVAITAIRDSAKPGREGPLDCWVLQAGDAWSRANLELEKPEAARLLLSAFFEQSGESPQAPVHLAGHRWRYAFTQTPLGEACLVEEALGLGLCGDWCLGETAESAFESGRAVAEAITAL